MKEEKKSIKIDPSLFTIPDSNNNTRKNKKKTSTGGIKIKTKPKQKKETLKKQSLLKMIRHHQEDKYKQLFDKNKKKVEPEEQPKQTFKTSFQDSKDYLATLMQETQPVASTPKNKTIKDRSNLLTNNDKQSGFVLDLSNLNDEQKINIPEIKIEPDINITPNDSTEFKLPEQPGYGCLKNGSLPTYRNFFNKTKKNVNNIFQSAPVPPTPLEIKTKEILEKTKNYNNKNYGSIHRKNKQKRIMRRTYRTGKSLKIPKITVLVSNKTIRNNTNLKIMKTKEVPITQVKRELIKRGLIRVGTITPNDVLRKMYETIELLCGDVQNYNKDNLLYNFIHDK